jgi:hypothetical protein
VSGTLDVLAAAIASEREIATEAEAIRGDATELTPDLFLKLYPLLCKPIPEGFIQKIGVTKGKPYESTGISSVQVLVDRMNNVLTPLWWWDQVEYFDDGKVAKVTVGVGTGDPARQIGGITRSSYGGVSQGSGAGNIYKGSYTNAAKLAFARLGPGHEVYLGAADLDPDVNQEIADAKSANGGGGKPASDEPVGPGIAGQLVDRAYALPDGKDNLQLAASTVAGRDLGDCSERKAAIEGLAGLTFAQAEKLSDRIARKEAEIAGGGGSDA